MLSKNGPNGKKTRSRQKNILPLRLLRGMRQLSGKLHHINIPWKKSWSSGINIGSPFHHGRKRISEFENCAKNNTIHCHAVVCIENPHDFWYDSYVIEIDWTRASRFTKSSIKMMVNQLLNVKIHPSNPDHLGSKPARLAKNNSLDMHCSYNLNSKGENLMYFEQFVWIMVPYDNEILAM